MEGNYVSAQGGRMAESDSGGSGSGVQEEKSVYLFFSKAALKALCSPKKIASPMVLECAKALENLAKTKKRSLMWINYVIE